MTTADLIWNLIQELLQKQSEEDDSKRAED